MKKTKIIIPALGILLLSTAASVTGTVAWFSTNSQVSATGMTISAKTDSKFLIITAGSWDNTARTTTVNTSSTAKSLYPVAPSPAAPATAITPSNITTAANWHYAYSAGPDKYAASTAYTACETLTDYVASETFYVGLNNTSSEGNSANNIVLRQVTLPANTGISAYVVWGTNDSNIHLYSASTTVALDLGVKASTAGLKIDIYYFIDGENSNVYSENSAALTGYSVFNFDVNPLS